MRRREVLRREAEMVADRARQRDRDLVRRARVRARPRARDVPVRARRRRRRPRRRTRTRAADDDDAAARRRRRRREEGGGRRRRGGGRERHRVVRCGGRGEARGARRRRRRKRARRCRDGVVLSERPISSRAKIDPRGHFERRSVPPRMPHPAAAALRGAATLPSSFRRRRGRAPPPPTTATRARGGPGGASRDADADDAMIPRRPRLPAINQPGSAARLEVMRSKPLFTIGLFADAQYADRDDHERECEPGRVKYFREGPARLRAAMRDIRKRGGEVRSMSHRSPYDRVGVVNADP